MAAPTDRPIMDVRREIRFAVVLYGGVSLAVYINGVVQELLAMVRATAPDPSDASIPWLSDAQLTPTEQLYRRLAKVLHSGRQDTVPDGTLPKEEPGPGRIYTRFMVDIISGTSAGGINGIFLGKALARGQRLDGIAKLWIDLADIGTLLYDNESAIPGLERQDPPPSALNGRRMLRLLANAFDGMDGKSDAVGPGPLVDRVDCFVTTTDIQGLPIYLSLSDEAVPESWHRKFFQFRYQRTVVDDFTKDVNPMLAFAARCTSAFPLAFEPVQLADICTVLGSDPDKWLRFFPEYAIPLQAKQEQTSNDLKAVYDAKNHAFGDGGYLDNKPFGYAIDGLASVRGTKPMDRKVLYVEPSPEHPEDTIKIAMDPSGAAVRPTSVANTIAALTLASHETIRDAIQRIDDRNRLIDRVDRLLGGTDGDLSILIGTECSRNPPAKQDERRAAMQKAGFSWADDGLAERVKALGPAYGGYHRLKVANVTDDLALVIARLAGFAPESDEVRAIRYLAQAWRQLGFSEMKQPNAPPVGPDIPPTRPAPPAPDARQTENAFLFRYDLGYRLRRLDFVLARIDLLSAMDNRTDRALSSIQDNIDQVLPGAREAASVFTKNRQQWSVPETTGVQQSLAHLAEQLSTAYEHLRRARDTLISPAPDATIAAYVMRQPTPGSAWTAVKQQQNRLETLVVTDPFNQDRLADLLKLTSEKDRMDAAKQQVAANWASIDAIGHELAARVTPSMLKASQIADGVFTEVDASNAQWAHVRDVIRFFYDSYECSDLVSFPIRYATDVQGNLSRVDVVRISPEDAVCVVNERQDRRPPAPPKLAGTAMRNFGAFMDRGWRVNDITWGRLDGAERLIKAVLAGRDPARDGTWKTWVDEAHDLIFKEQVSGDAWARMAGVLATAVGKLDFDSTQKGSTQQVAQDLQDIVATPEAIRKVYVDGTNISRDLDRPQAMRNIGRGTRVIGLMLQQLGAAYNRSEVDRPAQFVTRLGSAFWKLVELATPGTFWSQVGGHILGIIVVAEVLLFGGALLLPGFKDLQPFSLELLGLTVLVIVLVTGLRVWMVRGPTWPLRVWQTVVVVLIALIILAAVIEIGHIPEDLRHLGSVFRHA